MVVTTLAGATAPHLPAADRAVGREIRRTARVCGREVTNCGAQTAFAIGHIVNIAALAFSAYLGFTENRVFLVGTVFAGVGEAAVAWGQCWWNRYGPLNQASQDTQEAAQDMADAVERAAGGIAAAGRELAHIGSSTARADGLAATIAEGADDLAKRNAELEASLAESRRIEAALEMQKTQLQAQIDALNAALRAFNSGLETFHRDNSNLHTSTMRAGAAAVEVAGESRDLERAIATLGTSLGAEVARLRSLVDAERARSEAGTAALREQLAALAARNQALTEENAKLRTTEAAIGAHTAELRAIEEVRARTIAKYDELRAQYEMQQKALHDLIASIGTATSETRPAAVSHELAALMQRTLEGLSSLAAEVRARGDEGGTGGGS